VGGKRGEDCVVGVTGRHHAKIYRRMQVGGVEFEMKRGREKFSDKMIARGASGEEVWGKSQWGLIDS